MIAALYVEANGVYSGLQDIDLWPETRDARNYDGPWPVVAHPPCERWGRYWHGSPLNPHQLQKGDDGGCFAAALEAVRRWGGVLEHPAYSHAWLAFGLPWPPPEGWQRDLSGGWSCHVDQGWYGHRAQKPTWLYYVGERLPKPLRWGASQRRLPPPTASRNNYEKQRRCGIVGNMGRWERRATPPAFRDLLLGIAAAALDS